MNPVPGTHPRRISAGWDEDRTERPENGVIPISSPRGSRAGSRRRSLLDRRERFSELGGALDFYIDEEHIKELYPGKGYDARRFSFQLSDHFPIWIQVRTDIDGRRLEQVVRNGRG